MILPTLVWGQTWQHYMQTFHKAERHSLEEKILFSRLKQHGDSLYWKIWFNMYIDIVNKLFFLFKDCCVKVSESKTLQFPIQVLWSFLRAKLPSASINNWALQKYQDRNLRGKHTHKWKNSYVLCVTYLI